MIGYSSNFDTKNVSNALRHFNEQSVLQIANKIYAKSDYELNSLYASSVKGKLQSEVESINFSENVKAAELINNWIETKTEHKIKNVVQPEIFDDNTMLVLINAIYFKALWKKQFEPLPNQTFTNYDGSQKETEFMKLNYMLKFVHSDALNTHIVKVPYKDTNIAMYVIIPDDVTGVKDVEQKLDQLNFSEIESRMKDEFISLWMPKFDVTYDVILNEHLKNVR